MKSVDEYGIIEFEIIGMVEVGSYLSIEIKCYDKDDFLLGTEEIFTSVVDDERFKLEKRISPPKNTVRNEFIKD